LIFIKNNLKNTKNILTIRNNSIEFCTFDLIYHTRLKLKYISALKTICPYILLRHVTRCTKLSVHRATPDHTSAHPDRPNNLQIQPITSAGSVQPRSNGLQTSDAPVHHARVHTVAHLGVSLSSRRRFSLSHPISHFRPCEASEPPQKGF
jgi:hypothetical protein